MKTNGFTLVEVLLAMALVSVMAFLTLPFHGYFISSQEVSVVRDELQGSFAKAQLYSMTGRSGTDWGVAVRDQTIVLFQGNSFASRDQNFDETFPIHPLIRISGFSEVIFARVTGWPDIQPVITLSGNNSTVTLTMNIEGVIHD